MGLRRWSMGLCGLERRGGASRTRAGARGTGKRRFRRKRDDLRRQLDSCGSHLWMTPPAQPPREPLRTTYWSTAGAQRRDTDHCEYTPLGDTQKVVGKVLSAWSRARPSLDAAIPDRAQHHGEQAFTDATSPHSDVDPDIPNGKTGKEASTGRPATLRSLPGAVAA